MRTGFPHSEICGSTGASPSSQLIAACYVLHRLRTPRHPPDALALTLDRSALVSHARRRTQDMERDHWIEILRSTGVQTGQSRLHYVREQNADGRGPQSPTPRIPIVFGPSTNELRLISMRLIPGLWWSRSGSNRRPQACKARALPTELRPPGQQYRRSALTWLAGGSCNIQPAFARWAPARQSPLQVQRSLVGPGRVERPTSRLSGVRSNHLSYEPETNRFQDHFASQSQARSQQHALACPWPGHSTEGRETKTAAGRHFV